MPQRLRKLVGMIVLLGGLFLYAMLVMTIAVSGHLPDSGMVDFIYYLVAGLLWVIPARFLIAWMERPDSDPQ